MSANAASIYRPEALAHHEAGRVSSSLVRFDPKWLRVTYALLICTVVAGIAFICIFSVDEYASGPAVVRVDGRRMITSTVGGAIDSLNVTPGQWVEANTVLCRMNDTDERAELARATAEFQLQLARLMADPTDNVAKNTLAALRARRESAKNTVEARVVRAPIAGVVSDVRVRPGQPITPGEVLLAVVPKDAQRVSLVAMVPADYRPMLRSGAKMRFELDGFRYEYSDVEVVDVSSEAVGVVEVQRFLGQERADAVKLDPGGKVFVTARLPASTFTSEGQPYAYYDGLSGTAEVSVRREPIIVTLIPALRSIFP
jgi:membrane fusion protein (multidrug efflux system)